MTIDVFDALEGATDALASGTSTMAKSSEVIAKACAEIDRLRAQLAKAREALKPFADLLPYIVKQKPDDLESVSVAEIRRAASIYMELGGE